MTLISFRLGGFTPRQPVRTSGPTASLLGALGLVGCASYASKPLRPEAELASLRATTLDDLRIEYAEPGAPPDRDPIRFDASDGLDEAELAAVALTIHPELRARRAEIGEAQALLVSAGLLPNPTLDLTLRPGIGGTSGTDFGLDFLFTLLRPDERPALRASAEAHVEQVRAEIAVEESQVVAVVRRARITVLAAEQAERLLLQEAKLRDEAVALVREQRELGETTEIALALVEMDRTTVERQLRDARAGVGRARRALNTALGLPPEFDLPLVERGNDLAFTIFPDLDDVEIDARLLAGRADLRAHAAEYRQAEQDLRLAVARQFPGLGLGPSYERDADGTQVLGLGASIEVPLFDRNQGEIAEKVAARERERAEYVAALHELRARAFEARAELRRARGEVELQMNEVLPLVDRTERLYEQAIRARELSVLEWLTSREHAIEARKNLLFALASYAGAAVDLDSATGTPLVTVLTRTSGDESEP